jgi:hypothetical protein
MPNTKIIGGVKRLKVIFFKDKPPEVFVSDNERKEIKKWQEYEPEMIISESKLNIINSKEKKK